MALDDSFRVNNDLIVGGNVYANVSSTSATFTTVSSVSGYFEATDTKTKVLSAGVDLLDIFLQKNSFTIPASANWESTYTTVLTNSADWGTGGSGGGGTGSGSSGAFVTNVSCPGLTSLIKDNTQVAVNGQTPVLSAEVDDPSVTFTVQWEGMADTWTGYPEISGNYITKSNTSVLGSNVRRYEGDITIDLSSYAGSTVNVPYIYDGLTKNVAVTIAGAGPEIVDIQVTGTEPFGQDHYKDGDTIEFTVLFNSADVSSISLLDVGAATGNVTDLNVTMNGLSATFTTTINTSVTSRTNLPVKITAKNAFGTPGNLFTSGNIVDCLAGPVIESVTFGSLPGTQTELKSGDTIQATFTFDTSNVDQVNLDGTNDNNLASSDQTVTVTPGVTASKTITIHTTLAANTGGVNGTGGQDRPIKARAKKNGHHGNWGNFFTSTTELTVNNQQPTFSSPSVTYPAGQQAIGPGQSATVNIVVSNQGATAGGASYSYSTTSSQISVANPSTYDVSGDKTVSTAGSYNSFNTGTNNYTLNVTRPENGRSNSVSTLVKVVAAAPTLGATPTTRLRSGGNAGTSKQQYTVTVTSNQTLVSFDMDPAASAGVLKNANWTGTNSGKTWTNTLEVSDNDSKGSFNWINIAAVDLTNTTKTSLNTGAQYILGGFVPRDLTLPSLSRTVAIGTNVSLTSKLVATETFRGTITFDSSIADGVTLDPDLNTGVDVEKKFTIVNSSNTNVVDYDGDTFFYLDRTAAANNVSGTSNVNIRENV